MMNTKKTKTSIWAFTVISNILVVCIILYSGIDRFFFLWKETSLKYTIGVVVVAVIWYLVWLIVIKYKREFAELSNPDYIESLNLNADKDLMFGMCPKCENDCCYTSKDAIETKILICWNCQHVFSFAWCEKCGMGWDFIANISQRPSSWECPKCHNKYSIYDSVFDEPTKTVAYKALPVDVRLSYLARQMKFKKEQALTSVWFLSSLLISFTMVPPILGSFTDAAAKLSDFYINDSLSQVLIPCGGFLTFLVVFVSTWYGFMLYPVAIAKRFIRTQSE
jgi:hypothetical protein